MSSFAYQARGPLGDFIEGTLEVESREEALARLKRDGLQVLELEEESGDFELIPHRIRQADIVYVASQLSVMVETGIALSVALGSIAEQEANSALKRILLELKQSVESGEDFSTALARYPRHFDRTVVALIKASEQTGTLGEMLETVATYLRGQLDTRHKVRAAMAYPGVMAVLAVGVTIFLLTYILPKFGPLFAQKGVRLPRLTTVMMHASAWLTEFWYLWLAAAVGLALAYLLGRRTEPGRKLVDWVRIHAPVIGPTSRKVALSRSVRTLGTMVASGVSVLEALRLTAEVASNWYYEQAWLRVLDRVTEGRRICDALRDESDLFPATLIQMVGAGEETGKLDTVLAKVSGFYDREVENALKAATSMLEPLMICVMGMIVGSIALGLLLPIFQLSRPGA